MVDLVEIVGKVQLEAVVADAANGVQGVEAETYLAGFLEDEKGHIGQDELGNVQVEDVPAGASGGAAVQHMGAGGAQAG